MFNDFILPTDRFQHPHPSNASVQGGDHPAPSGRGSFSFEKTLETFIIFFNELAPHEKRCDPEYLKLLAMDKTLDIDNGETCSHICWAIDGFASLLRELSYHPSIPNGQWLNAIEIRDIFNDGVMIRAHYFEVRALCRTDPSRISCP